jgi:Tol biopolymer transport system component
VTRAPRVAVAVIVVATLATLTLALLAFNADAQPSASGRAGTCARNWGPREELPLASRDGRTLAWRARVRFTRSYHVYVSARDGSGVRVVSVPEHGGVRAEDAPWFLAPDGSQVLIQRSGEASRFILASTRQQASRFVTDQEARELRRRWRLAEWSPDGRFMVDTRSQGLLVVPADGGTPRLIATPDTGDNFRATWSPDGQWITFEGDGPEDNEDPRTRIYAVRTDGSGLRQLAYGWGPRWSPDGSLIAFNIDDSDIHQGYSIGVVRPNGAGRKLLAGGHEGPDLRSANHVSWVDSRTLVFGSFQLRRQVVDIHTIRSDGSGERRVTYQCHLGSRRHDRLSGSLLGDTIRTFAGNDTVAPGPGADDVDTGSGSDLVQAPPDKARDVIRCGPGRDSVTAERRDRVARDCERVTRRPR